MFKLFKGQPTAGDTPEVGDPADMWPLPDMEAVQETDPVHSPQPPPFHYEEAEVHPAGVFTAELVDWRPTDGQRAIWRFRAIPSSDYDDWTPHPLSFVTGTTCRPDNHLGQLLVAMGLVAEVRAPEDLDRPETRAALRERLRDLDPDELVGRQCRMLVEHVRDELGDLTARIRRLTPAGWM